MKPNDALLKIAIASTRENMTMTDYRITHALGNPQVEPVKLERIFAELSPASTKALRYIIDHATQRLKDTEAQRDALAAALREVLAHSELPAGYIRDKAVTLLAQLDKETRP
jgi:hypothetical protein